MSGASGIAFFKKWDSCPVGTISDNKCWGRLFRNKVYSGVFGSKESTMSPRRSFLSFLKNRYVEVTATLSPTAKLMLV